jgi:putative ABC transport system permease protein
MLKNYLTIALRSIFKHRTYSLLVIFGLALGMAVFMLAAVYTGFNFSFDTFHTDAGRIHMVVQVMPSENKGEQNSTVLPAPLSAAMAEEFSEIEDSTRLSRCRKLIVKSRDHVFYENNIVLADPNFFSFFAFRMLEGNAQTCLSEPNAILLSEDAAVKYFGKDNPLGKTLTLDNRIDVTVTGIVEKNRLNSSVKYDFLLSMETARRLYGWMEDWSVNSQTVFVKLKRGVQPELMAGKFPSFIHKHFPDSPDSPKRLFLLSLLEFRQKAESLDLQSHLFWGTPFVVSYFLIAMAFVLLLVVCINFMNLSTARSMQRAKEIGMRKVIGARRFQLIKQFLGESVIMSVMAIPLAIGMFWLLKPAFISYVNPEIQLSLLDYPLLCVLLLAGVLLLGFFSGSYPAFFLSSFPPVKVLKGTVQTGRKGISLRKILVVSQFILSILMIVFTIAIRKQLDYLVRMDHGYNREQVLTVTIPPEARASVEILRKELTAYPDVRMVATARHRPINWSARTPVVPEGYDEKESWRMNTYGVGYDFIELLEIKILQGRSFSKKFVDTESLILNETAIKQLQWDEPIGKELRFGGKRGLVIGVAKDYLFDDAHWKIEPSVFFLEEDNPGYLFIKTTNAPIAKTIEFVRERWRAVLPALPFSYSALQDRFEFDYQYIESMYVVFGAIGLFAIFISCLGLVAMAFYSVGRRTKEIGVRKVLGASVPGIIRLLLLGFLKLVIIANLIAWPLTYVLLKQFLGWAWAYTTDISVTFFVLAGLVTLAFAVLSVVYQTVKASLSNPAVTLRYE